ERLRREGVIVFESPSAVAQALAVTHIWHGRDTGDRSARALSDAPGPARIDSTGDLYAGLEAHGGPVPPWALVDSPEGAVAAGERLPGPWALKSASLALGRKS